MQYTVVGQVGVDGRHAVNPVQQVLKNDPEPVLVHLHVMAGTVALETRGKNNSATSSHALVRNAKKVAIHLIHKWRNARKSLGRVHESEAKGASDSNENKAEYGNASSISCNS